MPYNFRGQDPGKTARGLTGLALGVGTGLLGDGVPFLGLVAGGLMQVVQPGQAIGTSWEHVNDGVVDGSAALLARFIARSALTPRTITPVMPSVGSCRGCAQGQTLDDSNALAG